MHFFETYFAFNLLCVTMGIYSYSTGPPETRCSSMAPGTNSHGQPQNSTAPFMLLPSKSTYSSGDTLTVTIVGTDSGTLKGFYVQARPQSMTSEDSIGRFSASIGHKLLNCFNKNGNSISHNEPSSKTQVVLTWQPEATDNQDLIFYATVVREKEEYWLNVASDPVTFSSSDAGRASSPLVTTLVSTLILAVVCVCQ